MKYESDNKINEKKINSLIKFVLISQRDSDRWNNTMLIDCREVSF